MNRFLLFTFFSIFLFSSSAEAAVYKGQKEFIEQCLVCHVSGQSFITKYTIKEWKNFIGKKGSTLANLHLKDSKAKKSWNYFSSKQYTKKAKHLKQFLVEYAKDSGNVPACN